MTRAAVAWERCRFSLERHQNASPISAATKGRENAIIGLGRVAENGNRGNPDARKQLQYQPVSLNSA